MGPLWEQTDHVCRVCFGRVYRRPHPEGKGTIVRCSNCGLEEIGTHKAICCCGITRGKYQKVQCVRQESPTPEFPSEIVSMEVPAAPPKPRAKKEDEPDPRQMSLLEEP